MEKTLRPRDNPRDKCSFAESHWLFIFDDP
jgi:hypothetical protein